MILVSGAAGFIGFHLCQRLLAEGEQVVGLDNLNDYYDPQLKYDRLKLLGIEPDELEEKVLKKSSLHADYLFVKMGLEDEAGLAELFSELSITKVCNLAAQAGVRYSLTHPQTYVESNIKGFVNLLECCYKHKIEHLVYASSSSVYGGNDKTPFAESDRVDQPVSLYAASKKCNELLAHVYAHLYGLNCTGLRFFTVYGPWGRPDMALYLFCDAMREGRPIKVFNHGRMSRDFTYVADIVEGVTRILTTEGPQRAEEKAPSRIYNIGGGQPVRLMDFVETIEEIYGQKAEKIMMEMQAGDVEATFADTSALRRDYDYAPQTTLREGVRQFVEWYRNYYA
ncbi:MAG: NAD-dependent epimerase/dehydratase family protein [Bacteroidota bacterium]